GLNFHTFAGLRLEGGWWLHGDNCWGVEAGGFWLEKRSRQFTMEGDPAGQPFFGRPFVNALTGNDNVYFVSNNLPDPTLTANMTGRMDVYASTRLWGWDINAASKAYQSGSLTGVALAGFRMLNLKENLRITESIANLTVGGGGTSFGGQTVDPPDSVDT